jgi:hypothetical protein
MVLPLQESHVVSPLAEALWHCHHQISPQPGLHWSNVFCSAQVGSAAEALKSDRNHMTTLTWTMFLQILSSLWRNANPLQVRPRLTASSKLMFSTMFCNTSYGNDIKPNIPYRGKWI